MQILRNLGDKLDPTLACLLVVDVQNDFCSPQGAIARRGGDVTSSVEMVSRLVHLIEESRKVRLPIIYIKTIHSNWTDTPAWLYRKPEGIDLETCREGTWGTEFFGGIAPLPDERVIIKHRYSAFIHTDLNTALRAKGVESVLVTGVATNVCVETTARDAFMYDYYVTMVEDCVATSDNALHVATLENMRRHFGLVVSSREIIAAWQGLPQKKTAAL
ncbi:MAG: cysteine hydrolase family protein [Candidatus Binatia bacterium]